MPVSGFFLVNKVVIQKFFNCLNHAANVCTFYISSNGFITKTLPCHSNSFVIFENKFYSFVQGKKVVPRYFYFVGKRM